MLKLAVYDTQCGAKFFRNNEILQKAVSKPFHSRWVFDVELIGRLLLAYRNVGEAPEARFLEVALQAWQDQSGSKRTAFTYIQAALDLIRIHLHLKSGPWM
jgi:hypothetical protein